jgi:predicted esterase YcpF (UPF0227 family)
VFLYLHGLNSSPASVKARQLGDFLAARGRAAEFACPALPHDPVQAVALAESLLAGARPGGVTLVGSSLGGFYAAWLAERHGCRAVLVNPAVDAHTGLESYLGPQKNLHTGETWELTPRHLAGCARFAVEQPTRLERYFLMVTTGDEVLDYRAAVQRFAGARQLIVPGSDHGFLEFCQHLEAVLAFADAPV